MRVLAAVCVFATASGCARPTPNVVEAASLGIRCSESVGGALAPVLSEDPVREGRPSLWRNVRMTLRGEEVHVDIKSWGVGEDGGGYSHLEVKFEHHAGALLGWCPKQAAWVW